MSPFPLARHFRKPALLPAVLLAAAALAARGDDPLFGRVVGTAYYSPTGLFRIAVPVLSELGGTITDTKNEVTFQDAYTTYVSIAVFPMDATQRWELQLRGTKDYLAYFFTNYIQPDFARSFGKVEVDKDGIFAPEIEGGSLITFALLPGGSMFPNGAAAIDPARPPPVAKRGTLVFLRPPAAAILGGAAADQAQPFHTNGYLFVISIELGERATEGTAYTLTPAEENATLRSRLTEIAGRMTFMGAAASPSP